MSDPNQPLAVPALDLKAQYRTIRDEIEPVVRQVLESQYFILGPEVAGFEAEAAAYCEAAHAVGCSSGSDALLLPLMALGLEPGDEVVTTPYSFFATAGAIWRTGARPVFVNIEPDTYNIDPARIEAAITPKTRAIIPVHLYGQAADMDPINEVARKHKLFVLEDAAQAIGAGYHGRRAGTLGDAAAFSFYPSKNLGGFGDAGMVTTDDTPLGQAGRPAPGPRDGAEVPPPRGRLQRPDRRPPGRRPPGQAPPPRRLDRRPPRRRRPLPPPLRARTAWPRSSPSRSRSPATSTSTTSSSIRVPADARDPLRDHLTANRVGSEIYYPIPLHLQACFASLGHKPGDFPISEAAAAETIALPIYPELTDEALRHVVGSIAAFFDAQTILPFPRQRDVA